MNSMKSDYEFTWKPTKEKIYKSLENARKLIEILKNIFISLKIHRGLKLFAPFIVGGSIKLKAEEA